MTESKGSIESLFIKVKQLKTDIYVMHRLCEVDRMDFLEVIVKLNSELNMLQSNGQYPNIVRFSGYNFHNWRRKMSMLPSSQSFKSSESVQANALISIIRDNQCFQLIKNLAGVKNSVGLVLLNDLGLVESYF